jgi:hypothetical protein
MKKILTDEEKIQKFMKDFGKLRSDMFDFYKLKEWEDEDILIFFKTELAVIYPSRIGYYFSQSQIGR